MSPPPYPSANYPAYPYYGYPQQPYYTAPSTPSLLPPGRSAASTALVFFSLAAFRDFLMIFFVIADGPFHMGWAGLPFSDYWVLALVPASGALASAYCAFTVRNPKDKERTTVASLVALGCSAFPGLILVGPVGLLFAGLGVGLFFKSQRQIKDAAAAGVRASPQNP